LTESIIKKTKEEKTMEKTFEFTVYAGNIQETEDVEGYHEFLLKHLPGHIDLDWVENVSGACYGGVVIKCDSNIEECHDCKFEKICHDEKGREYSEATWNAYCYEEPERLKAIFSEFEEN
jgi:hypothetical protein